MTVSDDQFAAISAEFEQSSGTWSDSLCLEPLLCTAHEHGVLRDVWIHQLLDDRDTFLVSVEVAPAVFAHTMPTPWPDLRPAPDTRGVAAVRHVLERLDAISQSVIQPLRGLARSDS